MPGIANFITVAVSAAVSENITIRLKQNTAVILEAMHIEAKADMAVKLESGDFSTVQSVGKVGERRRAVILCFCWEQCWFG